MKIKFTDEQIDYAIRLAKKRHEAKSRSFRNSSIYTKQEDMRVSREYLPHFVGLIGEMAWALYSGEKVDEEIYKVRDKGEDFSGTEVKTITYFGEGEPELKIKQSEYSEKTPDTYVLVRYNDGDKEAEILGKISREKFDELKVAKRYGRFNPNNFVVPASLLDRV